jgi:hypothetical protein
VPIALGAEYLYPWARPDFAATDKLEHQAQYLNLRLFCLRAAVCFALWLGVAALLTAWSQRLDRTGDERLARKCRLLSGVGAVIYGVTLHFAALDWAMSLQPAFHSTIFGPLVAMGQLLSALALAVIVLLRQADRPSWYRLVSAPVRNDLGNLLLTFLVAWAYLAWFQFMLIWIANLPVDIIYYLPRATLAWKLVLWAIVLLHFLVPFFLLLIRPIKRRGGALRAIATLLLAMQLVFMYYQITPTYRADALLAHWMDFLTPVALGGLWCWQFLLQLRREPLPADRDPQRAIAVRLRQLEEAEAAREEALAHG